MIIRRNKRRIRAILDHKTGITYIKIRDDDNDKSKETNRISYWSTSVLVHDYEDQFNNTKSEEHGRISASKKVTR